MLTLLAVTLLMQDSPIVKLPLDPDDATRDFDCGNAYYDCGVVFANWGIANCGDGYTIQNTAGSPDCMYAVRFDPLDFGFPLEDLYLRQVCISNGSDLTEYTPDYFIYRVYPESNGLPDEENELASFTGTLDGSGPIIADFFVFEIPVSGPIWVVLRGDPETDDGDIVAQGCWDGASQGHSFISINGIDQLEPHGLNEFMIRLTLENQQQPTIPALGVFGRGALMALALASGLWILLGKKRSRHVGDGKA